MFGLLFFLMESEEFVSHIFREEYGKITAILLSKFGAHQLENIEDSLQDALLKAMTIWPYNERPENPTAWLYRAAHNRLLDIIKKDNRKSSQDNFEQNLEVSHQIDLDSTVDLDQIEDSQLKMIFACCHPSLSQEQQIILSLKLIGGFGNKEIAKALLKNEEAIAKSFTRAKKKFKETVKSLEIPIELGLKSRLNVVLRVIYLLFTEGYKATSGELLIKKDICLESIRLALLLLKNKYCSDPNVNALIALMCFHAARFDARLNEANELVDLEHQDRDLYDRELIEVGHQHLLVATSKVQYPSDYHYQAAIAYHHSNAVSYSETDWKEILVYYNLHLQSAFSPVIALNRIVAVSKVDGFEAAAKELQNLEVQSFFKTSALHLAIKAELSYEEGNVGEMHTLLEKAIKMSDNQLEQEYWRAKLDRISKTK